MGNNTSKINYIGICGATRSGKSTLAKNIIQKLNSEEKKIIHLDDFFSLERIYANKNNWEIPESLDFGEFIKDLDNQKYIIQYKDKNYIIAEGFLLFKQPLCHKFDKSIFINVSKNECKERRMKTTRVPEWYFEKLIWPNYLKNNYHLANWKKNKKKELGNDLLVLDSMTQSKEEMTNICMKFILGENIKNRNEENEQKILDNIVEEYKTLFF